MNGAAVPAAGALTAIAVLGEPVVAGQAVGGAPILAWLVQLTREGPGDRSPAPTAAASSATTR